MAYDHTNDFVSLTRLNGANYEAARMPPLDFTILNLGYLGLISVVAGNVAPSTNQDTTAWLDTALPSYGANGLLKLWDGSAYVAATPHLFGALLGAQSDLSVVTLRSGTGTPNNAIGVNGDFYIRCDAPGGIYGPKAAGSWPAAPCEGSWDQFRVRSGAGAPNNAVGEDGNFYIRTDYPGGIYEKSGGVWGLLTYTVTTSDAFTGAGVPAATLGRADDIYIRNDHPGGIYQKNSTNTAWSLVANSERTAAVFSQAGVPAVGTGEAGDLYIRTDWPGGLYKKNAAGTAWNLASQTTKTSKVIRGVGVPAAGLSDDNDFYIRTDTPFGTYHKVSGAWILVDGTETTASSIHSRRGAGVPGAVLGDDGDLYVRTDTPFGIYQKEAGAWILVQDTELGATASGGASITGSASALQNVVGLFNVVDGPAGAAMTSGGVLSWTNVGDVKYIQVFKNDAINTTYGPRLTSDLSGVNSLSFGLAGAGPLELTDPGDTLTFFFFG